MDIALIILGIICLLVGLAGCIIPMLPGPPVAYAGLILLHMTDRVQLNTSALLVCLLLVIVVQVLDYITPMLGTKYTGGGKWANRGTLIGTIIGLFFLPWGIIVGPFAGAFLGAIKDGQSNEQALKTSFGSLLGFLFGTILKFVVCGYFIWIFVRELI